MRCEAVECELIDMTRSIFRRMISRGILQPHVRSFAMYGRVSICAVVDILQQQISAITRNWAGRGRGGRWAHKRMGVDPTVVYCGCTRLSHDPEGAPKGQGNMSCSRHRI